MRFESKFDFGDIVYQIIHSEKTPMMIVSFSFFKDGSRIGCTVPGNDQVYFFYDYELTSNHEDFQHLHIC